MLIYDDFDGDDDEDTADTLIIIMIITIVIMVMLLFIRVHFTELGSLDRPGKGKSSSSGEFFISQL